MTCSPSSFVLEISKDITESIGNHPLSPPSPVDFANSIFENAPVNFSLPRYPRSIAFPARCTPVPKPLNRLVKSYCALALTDGQGAVSSSS
jgi:hypothetical protein